MNKLDVDNRQKYIKSLQNALRKENASQRLYQNLADRETNEARRRVLIELAETESRHGERWSPVKKHC